MSSTFVNDKDKPKHDDRNRSQTDPKANVQHDQLEQQKRAGKDDDDKAIPNQSPHPMTPQSPQSSQK